MLQMISTALPDYGRTRRISAEYKRPYFITSDEMAQLGSLMQQPYHHFIEAREQVQLPQVLDFIRYEHPHMTLSVTSQTAFRHPIAEYAARHIAARMLPAREGYQAMRTCLQEAVLNAVIHGNLRMQGQHHGMAGFQEYMQEITRRIADEDAGLLRVNIHAWFTEHHITLCVADSGPGFVMEQLQADVLSPHGRGLLMIRDMASGCWQGAPNQLYMQFSMHG